MLTNGFALFEGEGAPAAARRAIGRVKRYPGRVLIDAGDGFEEVGSVRLSGKRLVVIVHPLEERGELPLVHGFVEDSQGWDGKSLPRGEFSILGKMKGAFVCARDTLGTRGLWAAAGSVASDYRMLTGTTRLVPPGCFYEGGRVWKVAETSEGRRVPGSFEEAGKELASLLEASVRERVKGKRRVAVSFSGGLDSSLLALVASRYTQVVLCSAYAENSLDERQTAKAASLLGMRLECAIIDGRSAESRRPELPPGDATLMDRALWCIYSITSELASKEGAGTILLGQLADELFGGYRKYAAKAREEGSEAAEEMMSRDVKACGERGFLRDEAACSRWAEARFPYADRRIVSFASGLPLGYKIRGDERKAVLRRAALELGLPEELARAPKKAAQFSSGTAKLLRRLTGF